MRNKLKQLLDPTLFRFLLVGVVNTAVGYGIMFGLYNLAGLHTWGDLGYWISSAANYLVGSVVSFFLNKRFTFRNQERGAGVVLRFAVNITVCWALAYGLAKPFTVWLLSGVHSSRATCPCWRAPACSFCSTTSANAFSPSAAGRSSIQREPAFGSL